MDYAAHAASKGVEVPDQHDLNGAQPTRERLSLRLRSATLSEFADASGALRGFELNHRYMTQRAVCNALAEMPGVRFEERPVSLWVTQPARFTFKGRLYEVAVPLADVWVGPVEHGVSYTQTEELVTFIKRRLLPRIRLRERSRFV